MKHLYALALGLLLAPAAAAQVSRLFTAPPDTLRPRRAFKIGTVSGSSVFTGAYEGQLGRRYSLETTLGYRTFGRRSVGRTLTDSGFVMQPGTVRFHTLELSGQLRRYLQRRKPALVGWYAATGLRLTGEWQQERYPGRSYRYFLSRQALLLRLGRQCQLGPRFTFDVSFGPELATFIRRDWQYNWLTDGFEPTGPRRLRARLDGGLALQLGYRF